MPLPLSTDICWRVIYLKFLHGITNNQAIAERLLISRSSVRRILKRWYRKGTVDAEMGQREALPHNKILTDAMCKRILDIVIESDAKEMLKELHEKVMALTGVRFSEALMCVAMKKLGYSRKRLSALCKKHDEAVACAFWVKINRLYQPDQLLVIDETSKDTRVFNRRYGYSMRNKPAISKAGFHLRGKRWSTLGVFALPIPGQCDGGFVDWCHVPLGFTSEAFLEGAIGTDDKPGCVLPHVGSYIDGEPRSVVLLDNCRIHKQDAFVQAIRDKGGIVEWLPPYCPELSPIEIGFRHLKSYLRREDWLEDYYPLDDLKALDHALELITGRHAKEAFAEVGYM